jgi:hypothetical protein
MLKIMMIRNNYYADNRDEDYPFTFGGDREHAV